MLLSYNKFLSRERAEPSRTHVQSWLQSIWAPTMHWGGR